LGDGVEALAQQVKNFNYDHALLMLEYLCEAAGVSGINNP
jgi:hypothetical protein